MPPGVLSPVLRPTQLSTPNPQSETKLHELRWESAVKMCSTFRWAHWWQVGLRPDKTSRRRPLDARLLLLVQCGRVWPPQPQPAQPLAFRYDHYVLSQGCSEPLRIECVGPLGVVILVGRNGAHRRRWAVELRRWTPAPPDTAAVVLGSVHHSVSDVTHEAPACVTLCGGAGVGGGAVNGGKGMWKPGGAPAAAGRRLACYPRDLPMHIRL